MPDFTDPLLYLSTLMFLVLSAHCSERLIRSKRQDSMGLGCDALTASFARRPIPETYLETGVFYQIRIKNTESSSEQSESSGAGAYITWDFAEDGKSSKEETEYMYMLADLENLEMYEKGADWYKDSHWAFLLTEDPEWYHLVNCGYPYKYATCKKDTAKKEYYSGEDINGDEFTLILDPHYPGNHSNEDFLFKPVLNLAESQNQDPTYQLIAKAHNTSIIYYRECENSVEEGEAEADKSEYLKMQSREDFSNERSEKSQFFTFSSSEEAESDAAYNNKAAPEKTGLCQNALTFQCQREICSFKTANLVFMLLLVLWALGMTVVSIVQAKQLH